MNSPEPLLKTLQHALHTQPDGSLCVAYSGGPDSTALLHALVQLPAAHARGLRALHVDHGLHPASAQWAAHCRATCALLGVHCEVRCVEVDRSGGIGLEAAARQARYAVFIERLHDGERLLLAHHQDDQVETVLLKLLRGAGPEGLGGMRAQRALGRGTLWRPLLDIPGEVLREYVRVHALPCIHDPSNDDTRLARNQLRHAILPRLKTHWPQVSASITHSASLCQKAADSLHEEWSSALEQLRDDSTNSLDVAGWLALPSALRDPLLAQWLHAQGLPAPSTVQRHQIERQCTAQDGQLPCIRWPGAEVHVWKKRLWAMPPPAPPAFMTNRSWSGEPLPLPDHGLLQTEPAVQLAKPLCVSWRQGGERIRPARDNHTRDLRALFQSGAIPPWQRAACPLLYEGDALIAVGDRWLTERAETIFRAAGTRLRWQPGR